MKFYKKLAIVYNIILWWIALFLVWGFYAHGAFYTWPPDWSKLYEAPRMAVLFFSIVVFIFLKLVHLVEEKAEFYKEAYERKHPRKR